MKIIILDLICVILGILFSLFSLFIGFVILLILVVKDLIELKTGPLVKGDLDHKYYSLAFGIMAIIMWVGIFSPIITLDVNYISSLISVDLLSPIIILSSVIGVLDFLIDLYEDYKSKS